KVGHVIGDGTKMNRLYVLNACAELKGIDKANIAMMGIHSWDDWHLKFGHISISVLQRLHKQGLVTGFNIDESSIPSINCNACIQDHLITSLSLMIVPDIVPDIVQLIS